MPQPANVEEVSEARLSAAFEPDRPLTIGLEEELMLLDPETLDLVARAPQIRARAQEDPRFKLELPAAQIEVVTGPAETVGEAAAALAAGRRDLADVARGVARLAGAGAHPFAALEGALNAGPRYERTAAEFGPVARRQLVFGLHVHVAVGGPERSLAVYNALRAYLPELAALAANAPFHDGRDTELASIRPKLSEGLPRQGVPPAIESFAALAEELRWGMRAGALPDHSQWWWEARLHPLHGTVEVRVPDTQATVADTAAVAAVVHALAADLADRHDAGERLDAAPSWRIAENRWSACRHGVEGTLADLRTGEPRPTRDRLRALLDELDPVARRVGCAAELAHARTLVDENGALRQRALAPDGDLRTVVAGLAERFLG